MVYQSMLQMSIFAYFYLRAFRSREFAEEVRLVFCDCDDGFGHVFDVACIDSCHADSSISGEIDVMFLA